MKHFEKSILFDTLRSLDQKNIVELQQWLHSKNNKLPKGSLPLFEALYPYFSPKHKLLPDAEALFAFVFPKAKFNKQKLRQAMSDLLQFTETWLALDFAEKNEKEKALLLAKAYQSRGIGIGVQRSINKMVTLHEKDRIQNEEYLYEKYAIQWLDFTIPQAQSPQETLNALNRLNNDLDRFYFAKKLRQYSVRLAFGSMSQQKGDTFEKNIEALLVSLQQQPDLMAEPSIVLYQSAVLMQLYPNNLDHFKQFEENLKGKIHFFPAEEARALWILAINYCLRKRNQGQEDYGKKVISLYEEGLEADILTQNGKVSHTTFMNALKYGLQFDSPANMRLFLKKFGPKVEAEQADNAQAESLARIAYSEGDYAAAAQQLIGIKYKSLLPAINIRLFAFRIFYEMEDVERMEKHLYAFQVFFLRRKKELGYHQKALQNYLNTASRLVRMNRYDKTERKEFLAFQEKQKPLFDQAWFLEKGS